MAAVFGKKCQDVPPPQLTAYNHLASRINAMHFAHFADCERRFRAMVSARFA
jgi:hypothetical protein